MRADAVRNRTRILDVARSLIAERGVTVGMDEIAAASGLAVGTLYRHFPTKRDLVVAALEDGLTHAADEIAAAASRVRSGGSSARELTALLIDGEDADRRLHALKDAAGLLGHHSHSTPAMSRMTHAIEDLLSAGATRGQIREDVSAADIYLLLASLPRDESEERRQRWVHLMLAGILRP